MYVNVTCEYALIKEKLWPMSYGDDIFIHFLYCNVLCCQLLVLMLNLINSYPRSHRNSFSVKIWRGKSLWKDANNGYNRCKGSEGSATCKTHRLTHKNSNVTESWWENFLRTYWRSFYWRSLASFPSTPMSGPYHNV